MTTDPFTMAARLCDDTGVVSAEPQDGPFDGSYLGFVTHLRRLGARARGDEHVDPVDEAFECTGHAHLAGEHIRCTSPAHTQTAQAAVVLTPTTHQISPELQRAFAAAHERRRAELQALSTETGIPLHVLQDADRRVAEASEHLALYGTGGV